MTELPHSLLSGIEALLRFYNVDPQKLVNDIGISTELFTNPEYLIKGQEYNDLLEYSARYLNKRFLGIELAKIQGSTVLGNLRFLVKNSATIGESINNLILNYPAFTSTSTFNTETYKLGTILTHEIHPDITGSHKQAIEMGLTAACIEFRGYIGKNWRPSAAYFKAEEPYDKKPLLEVFGENLNFNQEFNGILITSDEMAMPILESRVLHLKHYEHEQALQNDFHIISYAVQTENIINASITKHNCTLAFVSRCLGVKPRTLQHQLNKSGTSFQAILQKLRLKLALKYLQHSNLSITEISLRLQFAETSVFTRFIKSHTGKSPKQHR